jgi:hypothetical protein
VRRLNYGDLIHWGRTRGMIANACEEEHRAAMQRTQFFNAALGLAHVSIGSGSSPALLSRRQLSFGPRRRRAKTDIPISVSAA